MGYEQRLLGPRRSSKKEEATLDAIREWRGDGRRHYWDVEICKAIIQTENYIHLLNKNSATFREEVARSHGVDIKVVRPRGFIIAGVSDQLTDEKMRDDFRLLSSSLKNIDIILYDDLLNNLKNLLNRL